MVIIQSTDGYLGSVIHSQLNSILSSQPPTCKPTTCLFSVSFLDLFVLVFIICSGGLNYKDYNNGDLNAAHYNVRAVYKNLDPAMNHPWEKHGDLLKPRANHNTKYLKGQVYHIAGYATTYDENGNVGKWFIFPK